MAFYQCLPLLQLIINTEIKEGRTEEHQIVKRFKKIIIKIIIITRGWPSIANYRRNLITQFVLNSRIFCKQIKSPHNIKRRCFIPSKNHTNINN